MKLTIPTKTLATTLAQIAKVAKKSTTHPILGNVHIRAKDGKIELIGMDLEKRLSRIVDGKISKEGEISLPCARLSSLLATRSDPETSIAADGTTAVIRCGQSITKMAGLDPAEYPKEFAGIDSSKPSFTIPAALLADCVAKSIVQASTDESGPKARLCSVFFVSREGQLNIQATNGQRLIIFYTPIPYDSPDQTIIPRESAARLADLATVGDVECFISDNILTAKTDNSEFSTKLLEGTMPDFEQAFPKPEDMAIELTTNREQFLSEIVSAASQADELPRSAEIRCEKGKIKISARTRDETFSETSLPAELKGEIAFGVNPEYLTDALKAFEDESVALAFKDAITPFTIRNESRVSVVYPQRLNASEK